MNTKTKFKDNDNRKTIMKNLWLYNSVIFISLVSSVSVQAASLDTDFVTGETLTATRLNEVNSAVNDNNTRIGNLETTSSDTLSALTCAASEVAKFDGTDWACAADNDTVSSGDITAVTAGTGLSGGGTTGDVTINIDTTTIQSRVSGTCPTGQSIRVINGDGSVTCEVDTDTTYSAAGTGIDITGTTISIPTNGVTGIEIAPNAVGSTEVLDGSLTAADIDNSSIQQRLNAGCASGSYLRDIATDGSPTCETDTDTDTTYTAGSGLTLTGNTFSVTGSGITSYLSIPARGGFVAEKGEASFAACTPNTFGWNGTGSSLFTAMVNLPQHSTITEFTYFFWRGSPTLETTATLYRQKIPTTIAREVIASVSSSSSDSGHTSGTAPSIDSTKALVDNQNYTYYIETNLPETYTLCVDGASFAFTTP